MQRQQQPNLFSTGNLFFSPQQLFCSVTISRGGGRLRRRSVGLRADVICVQLLYWSPPKKHLVVAVVWKPNYF